jgi:predicted HTH domain antitoxin
VAIGALQRDTLSSGKAALAGMNRWEWEELPGARKIPRHYADEDLERDIAYATRGY